MQHAIATELGTLAVFEQGSGPALFIWPSLYLDHRSFDAVVGELATDRRCVVVDGPGHGHSLGPGRRYDLAACARAAMQVADALNLQQIDWVGNAWGGHVGVRAAIDFPGRVRSLTAIGSPMHPLGAKIGLLTRLLLVMLRLGWVDRVGALLARSMLSPQAPPALHHHVQRAVREAPRRGLAEAVRSISLGRPDLVSALPEVGCPTLFVAGSDDKMYPPVVAAAQAARLPQGRCETLTGAAHLGPLEQPRQLAAFVRAHV